MGNATNESIASVLLDKFGPVFKLADLFISLTVEPLLDFMLDAVGINASMISNLLAGLGIPSLSFAFPSLVILILPDFSTSNLLPSTDVNTTLLPDLGLALKDVDLQLGC